MASWLKWGQCHYSMSRQEDAHLAGGWISVVRLDGCSTIRRILEETENQRTSVEQPSSGKRPYVVFWVCAEFCDTKKRCGVYTIMEKAFLWHFLCGFCFERYGEGLFCASVTPNEKTKRAPTKPSEHQQNLVSQPTKNTWSRFFLNRRTHRHIRQNKWSIPVGCLEFSLLNTDFFLQNDHKRRWPLEWWLLSTFGQLVYLGKLWKMLTIRILSNGWLVDPYSRLSF